MIINNLTGTFEILHPAYPCEINFAGGTYPSALHACYAAMTNDLSLRSTISMTPNAETFATDQRLLSADVPLEAIWDRVADILIQKFSRVQMASKLDVLVDKENDQVVYNSLSPILGVRSDIASSLNMIGVITTAIAKRGNSKQAVMNYITNGGK